MITISGEQQEILEQYFQSGIEPPEDMTINGTAFFWEHPTHDNSTILLPSKSLHVSGQLNCGTDYIVRLPSDYLRVDGALHLKSTKVSTLPKIIEVHGDCSLAHLNLSTLPEQCTVDLNLDLSKTTYKGKPFGSTYSDFDPFDVKGWIELDPYFFDRVPDQDLPLYIGMRICYFESAPSGPGPWTHGTSGLHSLSLELERRLKHLPRPLKPGPCIGD